MNYLNFNVLIVEDEFAYADALEELINDINCSVLGIAESSESALLLLTKAKPDLILMDYKIKGEMDGISLAQHIKKYVGDIPIIFITSYDDDTLYKKVKEIGAYSFLNKPFDSKSLQRNIELIISKLPSANTLITNENNTVLKDYLYVKVNGIMRKIQISEIDFISLEDRYCVIFSQNKKFAVRKSLKEISEHLSDNQFLQVHRSYIVNTDKIEAINLSNFELIIEKNKVPIGRKYKDILIERLQIL